MQQARWQVVQMSRHPQRPYFSDYVQLLFTDFFELAGDRHYGEDPSIVGGFARFDGRAVLLLGHQKGRNTKENMARNFGMPRPEAYRKAQSIKGAADAEAYKLMLQSFTQPDFKEGVQSFLQKRPPSFARIGDAAETG